VKRYGRPSGAVAAVGVLAVLALAPAPASAEPVLDATCPGPLDNYVAIGSTSRLAQTFTAQTTGSLIRGEVEIQKNAMTTGDFVMQIVAADGSGVPTDTVLASTTLPNASVPEGPSRLVVVFATPASIEAGQQYAIVVSRPGSSFASAGVGERGGDPCPGQEFFSNTEAGSWMSAPAQFDLVFSVFVQPPPQSQPVAGRNITLDANKNKVKRGKKVLLKGQLNELARQGPCESGQTVNMQRKRPKQTTSTTFAQAQTDAQGNFSLKKKLRKTFEFRAQVGETATCGPGTSNTEKVKVKKRR
jgi:hypothetical protein